jgi:hypothetical protein
MFPKALITHAPDEAAALGVSNVAKAMPDQRLQSPLNKNERAGEAPLPLRSKTYGSHLVATPKDYAVPAYTSDTEQLFLPLESDRSAGPTG